MRNNRFVPRSSILLLAIVGTLILTVLAHNWVPTEYSHLPQKLYDSLHAPGFAAIALALFLFFSRIFTTRKAIIFSGVASFSIATLSEASQLFGPRNAEVNDLVADFVGIAASLGAISALTLAIPRRNMPFFSTLAVTLACLITVLVFGPTFNIASAIARQNLAIPTIVSFDNTWERILIEPPDMYQQAAPPFDWPINTGKVAIINLSDIGEQGMHIWAFRDWRDYKQLSLIVANSTVASTAIEIEVRDLVPESEMGNWFRRRVNVSPIPFKVVIPIREVRSGPVGRETDLANMAGVVLRVTNPGQPVEIYIDNIGLE